jgi:hypothetical protein
MYRLLLDCCEKYLNNLAEQYPAMCPDGNNICGTDTIKLYRALQFRVPNLYRNQYSDSLVPSAPSSEYDTYDQYALLDYVEFVALNMKTVVNGDYHDFFRHHHLSFRDDNIDFKRFQREVNDIFSMTGLKLVLTDMKQINRITDADNLLQIAQSDLREVPEVGLKKLLEEAIMLYRKARPEEHHLATEKIWDAMERLKTFYVAEGIDKKKSVKKLIGGMAKGDSSFVRIFEEEFNALTTIGNDFRIRHHEINKIDIDDDRFYDYFFNRCLSLIIVAIEMVICYE